MTSGSKDTWDEEDNSEALTDVLEDRGVLDRVAVDRRQFLALANGFGGAAALGALAGCTGGPDDGGDGNGGTVASPTATPEERQTDVQESDGQMDTVNAAILPLLSSIPIYVAQDEGYFEENAIDLQVNRSISGARETARLATGQLDLAGGSIGASTINAISRGIGIRVAADRVKFIPNKPSLLQLQVSTEHQDVESVADTEGLVWATNATGNVSEYVLGRALSAHGLTFDDVQVEPMPFPQMLSAFEGGSIDAALNIGALGTQARNQDLARHLEFISRTSPEVQIGNIILSSAFINQRPDVAVRWLEAYIKGIRRYFELGPFSDQVVNIYTEATDSPAIAMQGAPPVWLNLNGQVNEASLLSQQDTFACLGQVEEKVERDQLINTSLTEEAISNLGAVDNPLPSAEEADSILQNAAVEFPPVKDQMLPEENECGGVAGL